MINLLRTESRSMDALWEIISALFLCLFSWIKYSFNYIQRRFGFKSDLTWFVKNLNRFTAWSHSNVDKIRSVPDGRQIDTLEMDQEARTYCYHGNGPMFTIQTSTYLFYVSAQIYSQVVLTCPFLVYNLSLFYREYEFKYNS